MKFFVKNQYSKIKNFCYRSLSDAISMADAIRQRRKHFYKDREERTYEKVGQQMKTG